MSTPKPNDPLSNAHDVRHGIVHAIAGRILTINATPTAGGTGYMLNDVLTVSQGGGATVTATGVSGGVVTAVTLTTPQEGYSTGAGKATTGGTGTDCTIEILTVESSPANSVSVDLAGNTTVTQLNADNLRLDGNSVTSQDTNGPIFLVPNGNGRVDAQVIPGASIGGFPSGGSHITNPSVAEFANSVLTGHNLFGGNKQLWYIGSLSGSNDDIGIINRRDGKLGFFTNGAEKIRMLSTGDVRIGVVGGSDYLLIKPDGEIQLVGAARIKKTKVVANANFGKGASAPTNIVDGNYNAWEFTLNDDAVLNEEVPKDWAVGTDIIVKMIWYVDEDFVTNSAEVKWETNWSATPFDTTETISAPTHSGSGDTGDVNIPATAKTLTNNNMVTIPGASLSLDDVIGMTVKRIALTAGPNPTAEPTLICVVLEYTADKLGQAT